MKPLISFCFSVGLFTVLELINGQVHTNAAVELFADNFERYIGDRELTLVEFYAPWCGHCKRLAPEFEEAAQILRREGSPILLAKVDVDAVENHGLRERFHVKGYPTLKIIRRGGIVQDYNGPRESDGIVAFLKQRSLPSSYHIYTEYAASYILETNKISVVAMLLSNDSSEYRTFMEVSEVLRDSYYFYDTLNSSLFPEKGVPIVSPSVRVYKKYENEFFDIKSFDKGELISAINEGIAPLVVDYNQDPLNRPHVDRVHASKKTKVYLLFDYGEEGKEAMADAFQRAAQRFKLEHGLDFVIGDHNVNVNLMRYFTLFSHDTPVLVIHDQGGDLRFVSEGIDSSQVEGVVADFVSGKLKPRMRSEPIPSENSGPVMTVVARNIEEVALKSGKNVLVQFYAPWCGHCKQFEPVYEQVGKHFLLDDSVVVARIDGTLNEVPSTLFAVHGFPTLYFVDAEGQKMEFTQERTKEKLISFVNALKKEPTYSRDEL